MNCSRFFFIIIIATQMVFAKNPTREELTQELFKALSIRHYDEKTLTEIETLIKNGADVNGLDNDYHMTTFSYLLGYAWEKNTINEKLIDIFIQAGGNPHVHNEYGVSGVTLAAPYALEKLIKNGFNATQEDNAVLWASRGDAHLLLLLIKAGGNPNTVDKSGYTPLMNAVRFNSLECVEVLLTSSDLRKVNPHTGTTAMHHAFAGIAEEIYGDHSATKQKIIRLLVEEGLDINAVNKKEETPLLYAVKEHKSGDVEPDHHLIDLMLSLGADPLKKDSSGLSAIHYAYHKGMESFLISMVNNIQKYCPEKLQGVLDETGQDIKQIVESNSLIEYVKGASYNTLDAGRKILALYGLYKIVMDYRHKKFRLWPQKGIL